MTALQRHTLGCQLRTLRTEAGMTGKDLAATLGWSPSKVSKIENAMQTPTERDLRAWANATNAQAQAEDLVAARHTVTFRQADWRSVLRPGLAARQYELADLDVRTTLFRIFESAVIPGIVQTTNYARARFADTAELFSLRGDVDAAVRAQQRRQEILYDPDKEMHIVIAEAAVRNRVCPVEALQAQLDRLVALTAVTTVRFGIVPTGARLPVAPLHGFHVFGHDRVVVATACAELTLAQPAEIELYSRVFEQLAATAVYGMSARSLLTKAMDTITDTDDMV